MKLTFKQFEAATILLENSPESISEDALTEHGLTREDLVKINEGLLGDILGGLFGKVKEKILKAIPGSLLKKVDSILDEYKTVQMDVSKKTQKERDKIFKANADDKDNERNKEQVKRSEAAINAIEAASKSKKEAIKSKLDLLTRDKSDTVRNYVTMQLLQIQEDVANQQLKAAEEFASEEELDRLEKEVAEIKKKKEEQKKAIELSKDEPKKEFKPGDKYDYTDDNKEVKKAEISKDQEEAKKKGDDRIGITLADGTYVSAKPERLTKSKDNDNK